MNWTPVPVGFVLFSPDATTTGAFRIAHQIIDEAGWSFVRFRWLRLDPGGVALLYAKNRATRSPSVLDALVDELFALDWSLAALVTPKSGHAFTDSWQSLAALKGPSDPKRLKPEHLRARLGAESKIANFIHTSASYEDTLREAVVAFCDGVQVRDATSASLPIPPTDLVARQSIRVLDCQHDLKRRLLVRCSANLPHELEGLLAEERQLLDHHVSTSPDLRCVLSAQVSACTAAPYRAQPAARAFVGLCVRVSKPDEILQLLDITGTGPDRWERFILRCYSLAGPDDVSCVENI